MSEPLREQTSRPAPKGQIIAGKYEVQGVLGEGGTGIVYDARRVDGGGAVALKVIHAHLAGDTQIRGRFQREAAILRRLEGPHVCPILELGEADSLLYMALPKLDGPSLEHVLANEGLIAIDRALDVMLGICAALRTAHAQGVIHRDLKPANVILVQDEKVVVVDFGMAKIITGGGMGTTNLTAHNMVFGTPEYMSPEQARGDELDARCDVYAAGIILYEMLTGSPPFTGATPLNVLTSHLTSDMDPPSKRAEAGRVTPALESVVMHALARDRDDRYPTASALGAAIMHARAAPSDVLSLRPEAFATSPGGTDAFAVTMPAITRVPSEAPPKRAIVHSDTMPASPALGSTPPLAPSVPPPSGAPAARPRKTSSPPAIAPGPPEKSNMAMWIVIWVLAGLASIGVGIYFALK
ncbi:MAG: serine/threonine protein kinase [Labilithrix sp.]|nr:serine/threonine protein kinase [Labilithrix sp.]